LDLFQIAYKAEHRFKDCSHVNPLPFDFYLPDDKACIELDGPQHFGVVYWYRNQPSDLDLQQLKDVKKTIYTKNKDLHLLRIAWSERNNMKVHIETFLIAIRAGKRIESFCGIEYKTLTKTDVLPNPKSISLTSDTSPGTDQDPVYVTVFLPSTSFPKDVNSNALEEEQESKEEKEPEPQLSSVSIRHDEKKVIKRTIQHSSSSNSRNPVGDIVSSKKGKEGKEGKMERTSLSRLYSDTIDEEDELFQLTSKQVNAKKHKAKVKTTTHLQLPLIKDDDDIPCTSKARKLMATGKK